MDEMKINGWARGIVSKILSIFLKKKMGVKADIRLNGFECSVIEDKARIHLDIYSEMTKEELEKLLNKLKL